MDSDKIMRLAERLREMTVQKQIKWKLDYNRVSPDFKNQNSEFQSLVIDTKTEQNVTLRPLMECVFSAPVDKKVFRLIGLIDVVEEELKSVKLQLWNEEKDELEYEFPENFSSFGELFQLVRGIEMRKNKFYLSPEVEDFVDHLLKENRIPEFVQN